MFHVKQSKFKTVVKFLNDFFSYEDDKGVILGDNFAVIPRTEYEKIIAGNHGSVKNNGILFQAEIDAMLKNCKVQDLPENKLGPLKTIDHDSPLRSNKWP